MMTSFFLTPRKQKMLVMTGRKMLERKPYAFENGGKILWLIIKNFLASAQLSDSCGCKYQVAQWNEESSRSSNL